jgi:hypothetical protein
VDEVSRLVTAFISTLGAGFIIMCVQWGIREARAKSYCDCRHEYKEHYVAQGFTASYLTKSPDLSCERCSCGGFRKNERDPRNSPPTKFFP